MATRNLLDFHNRCRCHNRTLLLPLLCLSLLSKFWGLVHGTLWLSGNLQDRDRRCQDYSTLFLLLPCLPLLSKFWDVVHCTLWLSGNLQDCHRRHQDYSTLFVVLPCLSCLPCLVLEIFKVGVANITINRCGCHIFFYWLCNFSSSDKGYTYCGFFFLLIPFVFLYYNEEDLKSTIKS